MKPDNTLSPNECTKVVAVLLSKNELQEIENEFTCEANTVPTTEALAVIAKCRTARGWFV